MLHMGLKKLGACNSGSFDNVEVPVCWGRVLAASQEERRVAEEAPVAAEPSEASAFNYAWRVGSRLVGFSGLLLQGDGTEQGRAYKPRPTGFEILGARGRQTRLSFSLVQQSPRHQPWLRTVATSHCEGKFQEQFAESARGGLAFFIHDAILQ